MFEHETVILVVHEPFQHEKQVRVQDHRFWNRCPAKEVSHQRTGRMLRSRAGYIIALRCKAAMSKSRRGEW